MTKNMVKRILTMLAVLMGLSLIPIASFAAAVNGLADSNVGLDGTGGFNGSAITGGGGWEWKAEETTINGSATGSAGRKFGSVTIAAPKANEATLTITNKRNISAEISFLYTYTLDGGTITIDGSTNLTKEFKKELEPNGTVQIKLTSAVGAKTTSIEISEIKLVANLEVTTVFSMPENGTYTVDGNAITNEISITKKSTEGYKVLATPANGYRFMGWYSNTDREYISIKEETTFNFEKEQSIVPKFTEKSNSVFLAGTQLFTDLNDATRYAKANNIEKVVLIGDGTLYNGSYIIPDGVTLLIPFNETHTLCKTEPEDAATNEYKKPTFYSTLTIADGARVEVENGGAISIGGTQASNYVGAPTGAAGHIKMENNSAIVLKNGANLYAWGFITGSNNSLITAESGASVYEMFQIPGWRGGTATKSIGFDSSGKGNKVFPFSQYYVQNIETPLKICTGAKENIRTAIYAGSQLNTTQVVFIGSDGFFNLTNGYLIKKYDAVRDRLDIDIYGDVQVNSIKVSVKVGLTIAVSSKDFVFPITNNMSISLFDNSNVTINYDTSFLPGVEVYVGKNASITVKEGANLFVYDSDEWLRGKYAAQGAQYKSIIYSPTKKYTRQVSDLKDVKFDINGTIYINGNLYTTNSGADIISSEGSGNVVYNAAAKAGKLNEVEQVNTDVSWSNIVVTPAQLHNADGTYTQTADSVANDVYTYDTVHGRWIKNGEIIHSYEEAWTSDGTNHWHKCEKCDSIKDSAAHTWNTGEVTKTPTCTAEGERIFTCSVCSATKTEKIAKANHTVVVDAAKAPTCTETGLTEGSHCSVCNTVLVKQETVAAKGHTEVTVTGKAATCTEDGLTDGKKCSVCGTVTKEQEKIDAVGHKAVTDKAKAPTCTETGLTEGSHCSVCSTVLVKQETVAAKGHTEVIDAAKAPTCTETGLTEGKHCSVCNEVLINQKIVASTGHKYGEWNQTKVPTCTEAGEKVRECSVCHTVEKNGVEALGHKTSHVDAVEAGCETVGNVEYYHCNVCDKNFADANGENELTDIVVAAKGHTERTVKGHDATCTDTGLTDGVQCAVCNTWIIEQEVISAAGHKEVIDAAVEATCTSPGKTEGSHCSVCNEVIVAQTEIEKLAHDYSQEWLNDENGHWHKCVNCDAVTDKIQHSEKTTVEAKAASCTEPGHTAKIICADCGRVLQESTVIKAEGHKYGEWNQTKAPTCTEAGEQSRECAVCHITEKEAVKALGHSTTHIDAVEAGCETAGNVEYYHCNVCDKNFADANGENELADITVAAKGHTEVTDAAVAATCEEAGKTKGSHCSVCGAVTKAQEEIKALGHAWNEGQITTNPTCTEDGVKTFTCTRKDCGKTRTEVVTALGHEGMQFTEAKAATCTEAGNAAYYHCDRCEKNFADEAGTNALESIVAEKLGHNMTYHAAVAATCEEDGTVEYWNCDRCSKNFADEAGTTVLETIVENKLGHKAGEWETEKEASCTEEGIRVQKCTVCGKIVNTETIEKLAHDYSEEWLSDETGHWHKCVNCDAVTDKISHSEKTTVEAKAASCTEPGHTAKIVCADCGRVLQESTVIKAEGHKYGEWNQTKAPTCTEAGEQSRECAVCHITEKEAVKALGHSTTHIDAVEAGCETAGNIEYYHCDACGKNFADASGENELADITVAAKGHTEVTDAAVAATCEEAGKTEGSHCSVCGTVIKVQEETAALGHAWNEGQITTKPTCTEDGVKTFTCTRGDCGKTKTEVVEALGHDMVYVDAVEAGCITEGTLAHYHCNRCDTNFVEESGSTAIADVVVAAKGHSFGGWTTTKEATRYEEGERAHTCSVCNTTETETIPKIEVKIFTIRWLDENGEELEGSPVTVEEGMIPEYKGKTPEKQPSGEYVYTFKGWTPEITAASVDTDYRAEYEEHTVNIAVRENVKDATCTEPGSYDEVVYCKDCGKELSRTTKTIAPHHHLNKTAVSDDDCINSESVQYEEYWKCDACGKCFADENAETEIAVLSHTVVIDEAVPAGCETPGKTEGSHCSVCGKVLVEQTEIPAKGHEYDEPEWTWDGEEAAAAKFACKNCDYEQTVEAEIEVRTQDASCTEEGQTEYIATVVFGEKTYTNSKTDKIIAYGHKYEAPSWSWSDDFENAYALFECVNCHEPREIEAEIKKVIAEKTCDEDGKITYTAAVELGGMRYTDTQEEVITAGHEYGEETIIKEPTCTEPGEYIRTCKICGEPERGNIAPLNHRPVVIPAVEPTEEAGGLTEGSRCETCGEILVAQNPLPRLHTHSYGAPNFAWNGYETAAAIFACGVENCGNIEEMIAVVTSERTAEATCATEGAITYTAAVTFEDTDYTDIKIQTIDKLPHTVVTDAAIAATPTTDGKTEGSHCGVCGEIIVAQTTILATGGGSTGGSGGSGGGGGGGYVPTTPPADDTTTIVDDRTPLADKPFMFEDVAEKDWFRDSAYYVYQNDMMKGLSETKFGPHANLNRAMIVTILYRLEGEPDVKAASKFNDVKSGEWYSDAIAWAAANDIVTGYDPVTFGPANNITREQLAAILYRYAQYKKYDAAESAVLDAFADSDSASVYAKEALGWGVGTKLINGKDGKLVPTGNASRAEAAAMMMRFCEKYVGTEEPNAQSITDKSAKN